MAQVAVQQRLHVQAMTARPVLSTQPAIAAGGQVAMAQFTCHCCVPSVSTTDMAAKAEKPRKTRKDLQRRLEPKITEKNQTNAVPYGAWRHFADRR